ncbi:hypothetical protein [Roseimaritima ulvae]|uniref:AAA+ ATPase domain-containing protein n=1 Tax=Roseimaritima ulvae TaxID=980254 RepID=A0A5B9QUP4_9BACT|nr:hypothetical protein [Roseimaritima ulvae]QEG42767.1 hypothetical protein UC8_48090 [Roseimaritima ulvae]
MLSLEPTAQRRSGGPPTWRRSNPFATRFIRPGARGFVARHTADPIPDSDLIPGPDPARQIEQLAERFEQVRQAAITGPHGNGKTTLLHSLLPLLRQRFSPIHMWRLNRGERPPAALLAQVVRCNPERLLIIDGFEQLPRVLRYSIVRWMRWRSGRLLVTSHGPVSGLPTLWQAAVPHALARRLTLELLAEYEDFRDTMMACFEEHWQRGQRNLRDLWFAMYDDFERHRLA